jgi:outer membrane receptor for ferrienterochelin and colicins
MRGGRPFRTRCARAAVVPALGLMLLSATATVQGSEAAPQRVEIEAAAPDDTERRRRDPVAKTIVGRDELDQYGDTAVSDVLKRLPGVSLTGGNPRLRGLGSGYTLVLINGEPAPPGFSLDNLSPSQVERIEITKGPSAERSTQAVAGTINIVLREAPRQRRRELRLGAGYTADAPVASLNAVWGGRLDGSEGLGEGGGALSAALPVSLYQWRNAVDVDSVRRTRDTAGLPQDLSLDGVERHRGGGFNIGPRLSWKLSGTDTLNWNSFAQGHRGHSTGSTRTDVQGGLPPISVDDRYRTDNEWRHARSQLQLTRRFADGSRVEARAGLQRTASRYDTRVDGQDGSGRATLHRHASGRTHDRSAATGGKWQRPLFDSHTLAMGWDLESRRRTEQRSVIQNGAEQLLGFDGEPFEAQLQRQALWLQDEWVIDARWDTQLGLRAEQLTSRSTGAAEQHSHRSRVVSPLAHMRYRLDPKGRDLLRASLTRSYRAPEPAQLIERPAINGSYPADGPNTALAPDRVGNAQLQPELATGVELALERYFARSGVASVAAFHRRISGLIRAEVALEEVAWSPVPRYVARPRNLERAETSGLEFEVKGRAADLLPGWVDTALALDIRASASVYHSEVDGIPGPDNRLDAQVPYALTMGFDHVAKAWPLTWGASMAYQPAHAIQQSRIQLLEQGARRTLDVYALWAFSRAASLRLSLNNAAPLDNVSRVTVQDEDAFVHDSANRRSVNRQYNASLTLRF